MDGVSQPRPNGYKRPDGWWRRWRPSMGSRAAQVGLQFVGDRMLLARLRDVGGKLQVEALRALPAPVAQRVAALRGLKQEGLFRDAQINFLLAPGQYDVHQLAAPAVPPEELHDALRWQLRGALGYPPEEALLDFTSLPQPADAPARQSVLAVTARCSVVAEALAPLAACGLDADAVDAPEFAQRNLAQRLLPDASGTHGWLAFDQDTFLLTAHCLGELAFSRRALLPNAALNAESETDPVAHFVERVVTQVQRSLDIFERRSGLPPVTQIIVGPHPHAPAIAAELGRRAALRVQLADSAELLREAAGTEIDASANETMAVLGAAMRAAAPNSGARRVQQIDLQRSQRPAAAGSQSRAPALAALVAIVIALALHVWFESKALGIHEASAVRLRADVQRSEKMLVALGTQAPAQANALATAETDVAALEALAAWLASDLRGRGEPFTEPLRAFARARADGVWLTGVRLNNDSRQLVLEGKALEAARVPQLLAALQREPRFAGTEFARIEMQPTSEPAGAVQFRIATTESTTGATGTTGAVK